MVRTNKMTPEELKARRADLIKWKEVFLEDQIRLTENYNRHYRDLQEHIAESNKQIQKINEQLSEPIDATNVCTTSGDSPEAVRAQQEADPETGQHKSYVILCEDERKKGFIRPVRHSYRHVGVRPKNPLRDLTQFEKTRYPGYVGFEAYPESDSSVVGRYWSQEDLNSGCGTVTTMGTALAETYAIRPSFYGQTFCCGCNKHLPVTEFVWVDDGEQVGS